MRAWTPSVPQKRSDASIAASWVVPHAIGWCLVMGRGFSQRRRGAEKSRSEFSQSFRDLVLRQVRHEFGKVPRHHIPQAVLSRQPLIGDDGLFVAVRSDLLAPVAAADLALAGRGSLSVLALSFFLV